MVGTRQAGEGAEELQPAPPQGWTIMSPGEAVCQCAAVPMTVAEGAPCPGLNGRSTGGLPVAILFASPGNQTY